ncbi:RNA polymerase sigma factor [Wenjunlia tyrosinilytica]|uniref:RNA polymerase sigma24 factor n=1 Tax=Wenjunlia tyrosinilytica TaxID=1544741 RepID=A0A917ZR18_9ACTN|nr:RNA polymerase sigma factor [Wenjunlia tyrosinilytica]GGO88304.1 RNA polymerase sigma24 factor [Wenjunlia tyrosinilytica]
MDHEDNNVPGRLNEVSGGETARLTEALLLARKGDEAAFRILYQALNPELVRYARVMVGDDAEDVASEAWLQMSRDLFRFRGDGPRFRRFALVVTRNRARDLLRRRIARVDEVMLPVEQLPEPRGSARDAADAVLEALSTERAVALVATLPPDQAEAVMLRVVLGMDTADVGEVLGKRPGTVRMSVSRGLKRLGKRLEQCGQRCSMTSDVRG